jgi:hypothetical protein
MNKRKINASPLIGRMAYTTQRWRKCVIWTRCERGERGLVADVCGSLALHPYVRYSTDTDPCRIVIRLSHVPTGLAVKDFERGSDARAVAEALATVPGINTASVGRARRLVGQVIGA